MKFLVMGAGALGSAFGGMLAGAGHEVTLIGRERFMTPINEHGLKIGGIWGTHFIENITARSEPAADYVPDVVLLATKSFDTVAAVKAIEAFIADDTVVISMQNGIGNEEVIAEHLGSKRTMGGMVITGFEMVDQGEVTVTVAANTTKIGELNNKQSERLKAIIAAFNEAGIPSEAVDKIQMHIWAKALYNAALNPMSAIFRVNYGKLLDTNAFLIIEDLIAEAFSVAEAAKIELFWEQAEEYLEYLRSTQIPPTEKHRSSMLKDIEQGKKTEIEFLNGIFVTLGRRYGIPTPVNETITRSIRFLEGTFQR